MYAALTEIAYEEEEKYNEEEREIERLCKRSLPLSHPVRNSNVNNIEDTAEEELESGSSFLENIPPELLSMIFSYLTSEDIMSFRRVNKSFYMYAIVNTKTEQKKTVKRIQISRMILDSMGRELLSIKNPLRYAVNPNEQEVMNIGIDCGPDQPAPFWWNYCLHDMGAGDQPSDLSCPLFFRNINAAPAVWDIGFTLERHLNYFFADIRLESLVLLDIRPTDIDAILNSIKKTRVSISSMVIILNKHEFTESYLEVLDATKPREVTIHLLNQLLPSGFWNTEALRKCNCVVVNGGLTSDGGILTDDILNGFTGRIMHLSAANNITAEGILKLLDAWHTGKREISKISLTHSIPPFELRRSLYLYMKQEDLLTQVSNKNGDSTISIELKSDLIILTKISDE